MNLVSPRRTCPLEIAILTRSPLWKAQPLAAQTIREAIAETATAVSTASGEVSIVLADDSAIRGLNRDWRGADKSTNVLSFPTASHNEGEGARLFGDIVISYETLERECHDENRAFLHNLAHLTVHGFLHRIGYDHQPDTQAEEMEGLESMIMKRLNMPDPYRSRDPGED